MRPGFWQIAIIVLLVVLIFGSRRLPDLMRSVGEGIRGFRKAMKDEADAMKAPDNPSAPKTGDDGDKKLQG